MRVREAFRAALALLLAAALAGCATVGLGSRVMTFTEADMARLLEQRTPLRRTLLEGLLDVRVLRPTVRLVPQTDRLASTFDVAATERVSRRTLNGRIAIEYGLRYDDQEKAIRMTDVRVDELHLNDVPAGKRGGLQNLGALIAEHMLDDAVLYRFKPSDLRSAEGYGLKPGNVAVTSRGVEVTLAPVR
ncbi:MAG TPA: hypothetical protein VFZ93_13065 [Albitalea sp.]